MFKNTLKGLSIACGLIFIIGCASKGVEVRHYVDVKDRVDQEMVGNAGYLAGDPQPEDRSGFKSTRKIYVLEVSHGNPVEGTVIESGDEGLVNNDGLFDALNDAQMEESFYGTDNFIEVRRDEETIPYIDDDTDDIEISPSFTEYTVKKDDTLQKISKKFYDSFSKWPIIYEANKDVIENPDRIKPGIVIQIPRD